MLNVELRNGAVYIGGRRAFSLAPTDTQPPIAVPDLEAEFNEATFMTALNTTVENGDARYVFNPHNGAFSVEANPSTLDL